jgi:hypothetical protein
MGASREQVRARLGLMEERADVWMLLEDVAEAIGDRLQCAQGAAASLYVGGNTRHWRIGDPL